MNEKPLVSVIVITYNSSKWILECLDSIKKQTYKNIELIISDDCSSDDTIGGIRKWIKDNDSRFVSIQIVSSDINTGVTANLNRGVNVCKGVWIKVIAGDDALLPDAIEKYVSFVGQNKNIKVCHAKSLMYKESFRQENIHYYDYSKHNIVRDNTSSAKEKFNRLCFSNCIQACTLFIDRFFLESLGGFDESIKMCEDIPLYLKITSKGINIFFLNDYTARYRLHDGSINYEYSTRYLFSKYFDLNDVIYQKYVKQYGSIPMRFALRYSQYLRKLLCLLHMDRDILFFKYIYFVLNLPYLLIAYWYVK